MPYSETALNTTGTALSAQMKAALDAALTASGKYTKVTSAYTNATRTYDVWLNDGTTDGYEWYLMVMTDTANTGRLFMGGALEYSDATKIAKKAIRGTSTIGFTDANGYPLVSAGGAEMTFALGAFTAANGNTVGNMNSNSSTVATTAASGHTLRVLVTGQCAWIWYGTPTTVVHCFGIGTYQKLHNHAGDQKPLSFLAHTSSSGGSGGSVWQHPTASGGSNWRSTPSTASTALGGEFYSQPIGQVGAGTDLAFTQYVGSRMTVVRDIILTAGTGGTTTTTTVGTWLGLAPADFLVFGRVVGTAIGDTVTVDGKAYISVSAPAASPGLFVNTQPAV